VVQRSEHVRRVLGLAREEAEGFGHRYLGPEHLVLGVLRDGRSGASRVLEAAGLDLAAARVELHRLAGRGLVAGPRPSDAELLASLGIDLAAVRQTTEQAFGRPALGWAIREATRARGRGVGRVPRTPLRGPPMLISQALYHAGEQARAVGAGVVGPELLLLGVVIDIQTPWPRCMPEPVGAPAARLGRAARGLPRRSRAAVRRDAGRPRRAESGPAGAAPSGRALASRRAASLPR
jgi:Clp amino terminal domain, pathogenicity island component